MDKPRIVSVTIKKINELSNTEDSQPRLNTSLIPEEQTNARVLSKYEKPQSPEFVSSPASQTIPETISQDVASDRIRSQHLADITPMQGGVPEDPHDLAKKIWERKQEENSFSFKIQRFFGSLFGKKQ